ncbi:unnamed protein product [Caenorhabditis sp. 36 PRJEB53466]|nr:unnamed protein product [Caenorhabditis sp. 36 PRJEB53466]
MDPLLLRIRVDDSVAECQALIVKLDTAITTLLNYLERLEKQKKNGNGFEEISRNIQKLIETKKRARKQAQDVKEFEADIDILTMMIDADQE